MARAFLLIALLCSVAVTPAKASSSGAYEDEQGDPLESLNRAIFEFNLVADEFILRPVALGYRAITTTGIRRHVNNSLSNLEEPLTAIHSLLQGNLTNAGNAVTRFMVNSVFGVFGLFDVAGAEGVTATEEDFGQTLAVWGIGDGPYLMLPLLGPSNLRDGVGRVGDAFADPVGIALEENDWHWQRYSLLGLNIIAARERNIKVIDDLQRNSIDFYTTVRSFYKQRRDAQINNGTANTATSGKPSAIDDEFNTFLDNE